MLYVPTTGSLKERMNKKEKGGDDGTFAASMAFD